MRRAPVIAVLVVLALIAGGGAYGLKLRSDHAKEAKARDRRAALAAATGWLQDWQDRAYADVDLLTSARDAPGDALKRTDQRLQITRKVLTPGVLSVDGTQVPYTASASLTGLGAFTWSSRVKVIKERGDWKVAFDATTVHPALATGLRLDRKSQPAARAAITDRKGRDIRTASADLAGNVLGVPATTGHPASGLERVLADQLAGRDAGSVVVVDAGTGQVVTVLKKYPGVAPTPVRTSLDLDVQRAAESALAGLGPASALVAIDSATGQVRAAASRPVSGKPVAFTSYAPGSVFKVVTATALLENGLKPSAVVDCPPTYRGTGNASSVVPGPSTFARAFQQSCNTAFLKLAEGLPDGALARAAAQYGFGKDLLPIKTDPGSFPTGGGSADATAAIGQGRVEASPLLMADVLAAVESGSFRTPTLLPETSPGTALPAAVLPTLRTLLRSVVTGGSGRAANVPGAPVYGKTGSAEFGTRTPKQTHAWFAGYRSGLAFCVYVDVGASGGATAAPVAARFLRAVGS